jgi:Flp pilus assembly pilin Flp
MFHLLSPSYHDDPLSILDDLSAVAEALAYGFRDNEAAEATDARRGYGLIASALSAALLDVGTVVKGQIQGFRRDRLAEMAQRYESTEQPRPKGAPDLTEPVGDDAPSPEELLAEARRAGQAHDAERGGRRRIVRAG